MRIGRLRDSALGLSLCIGGDEGLAPGVREAARFSWSLSRLTLPHRLARLLVLGAALPSLGILRGSPYHSQSGCRGPTPRTGRTGRAVY